MCEHFSLIQSDLKKLFEYIEPSEESSKAYSYRIHELLIRTCIEVEANFKAILVENNYSPTFNNSGKPKFNISVYKKINISHHLSSYEVLLPIWNGPRKIWKPFEAWATDGSLAWYQAYNTSKHDRHEEFKKATLEALICAVAGLLVILSAQFRSEDFSAGSVALIASGYDYHEMEAALGDFFRIEYPNDWTEAEIYDFDWSRLSKEAVRFQKFDYNRV